MSIGGRERVAPGTPTRRKLVEGDLLKLDYGVIKHGYYGDSARTVAVGRVSPDASRLLEETRVALEKGIAAMVAGNRISDIGSAIEAHVSPFGYGIVPDYVGHGIGKKLHEEPQGPNYGPSPWSPRQPDPRPPAISAYPCSRIRCSPRGWRRARRPRAPRSRSLGRFRVAGRAARDVRPRCGPKPSRRTRFG